MVHRLSAPLDSMSSSEVLSRFAFMGEPADENRAARAVDVPTKVFGSFLDALEVEKIPPEVVSGLRKALLDDKSFSEATLKAAILTTGAPLA